MRTMKCVLIDFIFFSYTGLAYNEFGYSEPLLTTIKLCFNRKLLSLTAMRLNLVTTSTTYNQCILSKAVLPQFCSCISFMMQLMSFIIACKRS